MAESALAKMPKPARVAVSIGLLLLGALAYYVVFYSDVSGAIERTKLARTGLQRELDEAKKAESSYQKDLEELAKRRERERELNKVLPETTEYPAFLSAVQSVANMSGVDLTAWTPEPEIREEYYARVPMTIELKGRFHQIAKFFYGVGQNDRIMNIENISLSKPRVVDQDIYLEVRGLVTAFRALSAEDAAKKDAKQKRRK